MQAAFPFIKGEPRRPKRPERLFFGLLLRAEAADCVGQFGQRFFQENQLPGKPLEAERLHLSLHHIGDYKRLPSNIVYGATLAGRDVSMRPLEVTFAKIKSFEAPPSRKDRPLVLLGEGEGLFALHGMLGSALRSYGFRAADHFTPHVTLLYGPKPVPAQPIEPLRVVFDEFVLIHSELWLTRYHVLGRWPLRS